MNQEPLTHMKQYDNEYVLTAIDDLVKELDRAEHKHPIWPSDQLRQVSIINGEAGEAMQASLHVAELRRGASLSKVRDEVIQTGAMCLRWLKNYIDLIDAYCEKPSSFSGVIDDDIDWDQCQSTGDDKPCNFDPKSRYYDAGGIEVQEIIKAKLTPEQYKGFCLGNAIKYACRANFNGDFDRDIEKIGFYQKFIIGDNA